MSIRDKVLNAQDIGEQVVSVPQWGVDLLVRGMTVNQRNTLLMQARKEDGTLDLPTYYAGIVQACSLDPETREQVFAPDDIGLLGAKSPAAIDLVTKAALALSGLEADADVAQGVEAAGKGSSSTQTGESSS
jgi:hypothetical protein